MPLSPPAPLLRAASVPWYSLLSDPIRPPSEVFRIGDILNEATRGHYQRGATLFVDRLGRRWVRVRTRVFFANWLADPTPCKAYRGRLDCDPHRLPQLPRHGHHHIFAERRKTGNRPADGRPRIC